VERTGRSRRGPCRRGVPPPADDGAICLSLAGVFSTSANLAEQPIEIGSNRLGRVDSYGAGAGATAPPDQPAKVETLSGVAVRVTTVLEMNVVEQSLPQLMPAGEEVTVPLPGPVLLTVRLYWTTSNSAVTDLVAFMVTVQSQYRCMRLTNP